MKSLLHRARTSLRKRGPWVTLRRLGPGLYHLVFPVRIPTHPFDLRHGVDTSGLLYNYQLASGHPHDAHTTACWSTAPSLFHGILDRWKVSLTGTPHSVPDYTFIDIGCGKGRVLLMASEQPFRNVVGVELNPSLASVAQTNLQKWSAAPNACDNISVLHADVLEVPIPASPVLLYLYNPFGEAVMQPFADRLLALSLTRQTPIDIIYVSPEQAPLLERLPGLTRLWTGNVPLTPEDTAADAFHMVSQLSAIYRLAAASSGATTPS